MVPTADIRKVLSNDGMLCPIALTLHLFYLDLVFGLLEDWWLFNNSREHLLPDETRWERCLRAAGFWWVNWSDNTSEESNTLRQGTKDQRAERSDGSFSR